MADWQMTKKKKMLLVGPVPPPAGGVSIHLWRLKHLLADQFEIELVDESRNIKPAFFNIRQKKFLTYWKKVAWSDFLFIHSGLNALRFFHILSAKLLGKKVVLTLHAYPEEKSGLNRWIDEQFFGWCDAVISVNSEMLQRVTIPAKKTFVQYAFLPPVMQEEKELPARVQQLLNEQRAKGKKIIVSNAWRLDRFNNQDVYGVDMCIEAVKNIKEAGERIHFIFNIATIDMFGPAFEAYQQQIIASGIQDEFSLINEELSFVKLMEQADMVVRPTNTDGDSLSIREAIFLNKPIISSDVVKRPDETILFENRNQEAFEKTLLRVLQNGSTAINPAASNSYDYYKSYYTNLLGTI
ncbi:glycosyltransferase [Flavihumibacter sp. UBA7668]|uniref:glycosyltransferase n=1 Tax=Flavihumibacter sp. UBA7668 TaxID=1946542 RepID=UPI0025C382FF|nr:glycosyltransferase [Flavihumibacter sp. UBA7668]